MKLSAVVFFSTALGAFAAPIMKGNQVVVRIYTITSLLLSP